jgi:hypothetical protein
MTVDQQLENNDDNAPVALAPRGANQVARQDFGGTSLAMSSAQTDALVAKARADVEARWILAMRRPRNLDDVRQSLIAECSRPQFARVAVYARPVGKKQDPQGNWINAVAEGLSIRFAEAAARCMGNLQPDVQTIYDGADTRIVRVTVTDYESNVTWSRDLNVRKTVERKQLKRGQKSLGERLNSYGDRVFIVEATDDEVNVKEAAMVSKAARTLILRVVPGHLQDECKDLCKRIAAQADAKDPAANKNRALDAFASLGIKPSQILEYLGKPIEQATRDEWRELSDLVNAIRDGETTWAEALEAASEAPPKTAQAAPTSAPQQAPAEPAKVAPAAAQGPAQQADKLAAPKAARGAAALKQNLKAQEQAKPAEPPKVAEPAPAAAVADPAEREPGWMSGKDPKLEPDENGLIEVACTTCKNPMDLLATELQSPPTHQCYACRQG